MNITMTGKEAKQSYAGKWRPEDRVWERAIHEPSAHPKP
jgi:hypothetical protein